jgi:toxin ParE1/3/4
MSVLEWSQTALLDLANIHTYISADSKFYADHFVARLVRAAERASEHPKSGRRVPEADDDTIRELIFQNYRIVYQQTENSVRILTVLHGARDASRLDPRPWNT